ncbi:hypothetical protein [Neorhizobium alkalisoli]|nr:hypothetical protein [Neorhizobium alkalisoli]
MRELFARRGRRYAATSLFVEHLVPELLATMQELQAHWHILVPEE